MTQRDAMRSIWSKVRPDEWEAIREYARMEEMGLVKRKSNDYNLSAEEYARALLNDGFKKGWL